MTPEAPKSDGCQYDVTVIIPAYNEQNRIGRTLQAVSDYFLKKDLTRQIVVVDDGSRDNTLSVVQELRKEIGDLTVVGYSPNRGKGYAVRTGVKASQGKYVLFTDADNSTPIEEFDRIYPILKDNEVVIGSRYTKGSNIVVKQPKHRILIGRLANRLIQTLLLEGIKDTQCGFKAFQCQAAHEIFCRACVDRFAFDIELLSIARLLGFSIKEVPVSWYDSPDSRVRPIKDTLNSVRQLLHIKLNLWLGRYGCKARGT